MEFPSRNRKFDETIIILEVKELERPISLVLYLYWEVTSLPINHMEWRHTNWGLKSSSIGQ